MLLSLGFTDNGKQVDSVIKSHRVVVIPSALDTVTMSNNTIYTTNINNNSKS